MGIPEHVLLDNNRINKEMTKERFDSKWIPEPNTGCWIWIACSLPCGYGTFRLNRKMLRAHRASWIIRKGEIPVGVDVLHRCDTPLCVNPDHLFLGNDQDNKNDSVAKNRHSKGERQGLAKLTDEKVRQIRSSNGLFDRELAEIYNVSRNAIRCAKKGITWKHV